jgi:hypothetical protein
MSVGRGILEECSPGRRDPVPVFGIDYIERSGIRSWALVPASRIKICGYCACIEALWRWIHSASSRLLGFAKKCVTGVFWGVSGDFTSSDILCSLLGIVLDTHHPQEFLSILLFFGQAILGEMWFAHCDYGEIWVF